MAIDLDYMVKLKDGRVVEREMVRGELRDVICGLVDELNPTWSENDNDEFPAIITTNHGDVTKTDVNGDEFVQIRSDELEYAELLIENGLIQNESTFVLESGYIYIVFFAPTEEFKKYIEENVK